MQQLNNAVWRACAALVFVVVAGCGGGGGGGDSPTTPPAPPASKVFVGDSGHGAIGSSANSNPSAGTGTVDRTITGGSTFLTASVNGVRDFALDATNDRLFVSDSNHLLAFDNVSVANGNVAARVVATATGGDTFSGIYLDTVHNLIYATVRLGVPGNEVRVYNNASTASNAVAARTFSFTCDFMFDIAVDTTLDVAYVYYVTGGVAHVAVLTGASALTGSLVPPAQTIDFGAGIFPASTAAIGIFLDTAHDRLYVPDVIAGPTAQVAVFDNAHTKSGASAQSRNIVLAGGVISYGNVFVELSADRLYVAVPTSLTIAASASTTTSSLGGVQVLPPAGSTFTAVAVKP